MARVYDGLLDGKDNYQVDRDFITDLEEKNPHVRQVAHDNRAFLARAVRLTTARGIRQFLDIGTGLPTQDNVHQVAQRVAPECRVVYVDNDPMVLTHARALLTSTPEGRTDYVFTDAHDTDAILSRASQVLDLTRPTALLVLATAHFFSDAEAVIAPLRDALVEGSYLAITHAVARDDFTAIGEAYQERMGTGYLRTPEEISALFGEYELLEPGLTALPAWHPDDTEDETKVNHPAAGLFLGGVGRKVRRS